MRVQDVTRNLIGSGKMLSQSNLVQREFFRILRHYKKGLLLVVVILESNAVACLV